MAKANLTDTLASFVNTYNALDSSFSGLDSDFRAAGLGDSTSPKIIDVDSAGNPIPLATTNKTIVGAINELDSNLGDFTSPGAMNPTIAAKTIAGMINELDSATLTNDSNIGTMASLTTNTKSSLVDAINELDSALDNLNLAVGGAAADNLSFGDNKEIIFGNDSDARIFTNGSDLFLDLQSGINNFIIRDGTTVKYTFDDNGDFTAEGNVTAYSDERLKENIETIKDALFIVDSLRGVYYTKDGRKETGVIAQEVKEILPEVVKDNGEYMSVAYGNMIGVMIEAIKELKAEVDELKNGSSN